MTRWSKRPPGRRYRNLYRGAGGTIWYERRLGTRRDAAGHRVEGRRFRVPTGTTDWTEAAAFRDAYEAARGLDAAAIAGDVPTLAAFAERYLAEDTGHLAATTRHARERTLRADGPVLGLLGEHRLDEVTAATLREWWARAVEGRGLAPRSGRHLLDGIAALYGFARDLGFVDPGRDPVVGFRAMLRRRGRSKRGRAEADPGRAIRPVEAPATLDSLVAAAAAEGPVAHALVLLLMDAGLRLGEALGLRWGSVAFGSGPDDRARYLLVRESRPRGGPPEPTKSGRERRVALSRRLRAALLDLRRARFDPGPDALVVEGIDPANFRKREWRRILAGAGAGRVALKDLRDTYASQLLTAGVNLAYVSRQLGHADVQVTARHYARWAGGDDYREPMRLAPGEVPADLLARLTRDAGGAPDVRVA